MLSVRHCLNYMYVSAMASHYLLQHKSLFVDLTKNKRALNIKAVNGDHSGHKE